MIRIDLDRAADLGTAMRERIESGEPDGPFQVWCDGKIYLVGLSLHRSAMRLVREVPTVGFADWTPRQMCEGDS